MRHLVPKVKRSRFGLAWIGWGVFAGLCWSGTSPRPTYTGEVARKLTNGRWHLNPVHGGIWEPYILFDDYDSMNPFFDPYRDIVERRRGGLGLVPIVVGQTCHRITSVG